VYTLGCRPLCICHDRCHYCMVCSATITILRTAREITVVVWAPGEAQGDARARDPCWPPENRGSAFVSFLFLIRRQGIPAEFLGPPRWETPLRILNRLFLERWWGLAPKGPARVATGLGPWITVQTIFFALLGRQGGMPRIVAVAPPGRRL
jgi:hypothetical protein